MYSCGRNCQRHLHSAIHECVAAPFSRVTGKVCVLCALPPRSAIELQTLPHKITLPSPNPPPPHTHTHPSDLLWSLPCFVFVFSILRAKIDCNWYGPSEVSVQHRVTVSGSLSHLLYDLLLPCIIRVEAVNLSVCSLSNLHCNCHELYQFKFKLTENVPFSSQRGWKNHYWGE